MSELIPWELMSFVMASKIRIKILISLKEGIKTPKQLANEINTHLSHVSRALKELSEKDLIECLTPKVHKNKFYTITKRGKQLLKKISENTGGIT